MIESRMLCVNGARYFHRFSKRKLAGPLDLLGWLQAQEEQIKLYWQDRDGNEIAAVGSLLAFSEPPHFDRENESEARFWGGHAFFKEATPKDDVWKAFPKICFFLPEREISSKGGQITLLTNSINAPLKEIPFHPGYISADQMSLQTPGHVPTEKDWHALITSSLEEIEAKSFEKVVIARRSSHETNGEPPPFALLSQMPRKNGISFALQFQEGSTFIGVTPERLYKREGRILHTEAIAGTRKRDTDPKELLENPKERKEFTFVKDSIKEALAPLCESVTFQREDGVIQTPNVIHLHNKAEGKLLNDVDDASLLKSLHPTAAMGGLPKRSALEYLAMQEPFERGWYASPLGYVSETAAEFGVGIRSALIEKNKVHFFAGAGIVAGARAENEWKELENKVSLWKVLEKQS
ncbi:MAG: isochorismate synthase [Simkaniaceae bacterium]|nr:isochorismate synthase [Candidatus Sacchlamyda saccharinae]